ncbi:TIGR02300 family protein [Aestuariispira insulae]|uniref:Uncharacterized protein (TIGR02300 family) n=1 Tax=Aestuariispira insulae TaxID=1461337 RepID=A0A3D9H9D1_9PROT|nr:TIGR02300 family protein [Aestuariispira insulae]RED46112.1 uncharacterized protein (TIGR02300 family) [Aestuariispira insulae]
MAKPEWGLKRTCLSCGAKFYDLQRNPIDCPKCDSPFDPEAAIKLKRGRSVMSEGAKPAKEADSGDVELLETDDDAIDDSDDDILEDTSDLDNDDGVAVVASDKDGDGDET